MAHERGAIRRFCLDCQGGDVASVHACADAACVLYSRRRGEASPEPTPPGRGEGERPARLIRLFCLTCAGDRREVRTCDARSCALWSFRFGVSPATFKRVLARRRVWRANPPLPGLSP